MAKFKGKLEFEDIGAGAWVLVTADGDRYTLQGKVPTGLSGKQVTVKGKKTGGAFGFSMLGGSAIEVAEVSAD
ncbi:MAG: hypothetical protein ACI8RZ_004702 [Myxococcota bacterium]|jgi:hypothetical protein